MINAHHFVAELDRPLDECPSRRLDHALGTVRAMAEGGLFLVDLAAGGSLRCELLHTGAVPPAPGDRILLLVAADPAQHGIVLGRVGRCTNQDAPRTLSLQASEHLSLQCGSSSIDLRADGKIMIRGEDVLVRAKGTQRIRAGTVSIN